MKITDSYSDITHWFFGTLQLLLEKQATVMVGLGGGLSFDSWYLSLIQNTKDKVQNEKEFFQKIRWCVTDERVNCDISERNDAHIWEVFLGPLFEKYGIPEENFIRPPLNPPIQTPLNPLHLNFNLHYSEGILPAPRVGVTSESKTGRQGCHSSPLSGGQAPDLSTFYYSPSTSLIDIAFFGMGPDGHTASLFPHHPALQSEELGFIKIDNAPKFPPERISLSPKSIPSLSHVCLFAVGESKKEALVNFLDETVSVNDCPAKLLKPEILFDGTR